VDVELKVTPDKYLPHRYAGASGDFYSMAQVARACTTAAGGDPRTLRRLSVQFRGMGLPEQEIVVTGSGEGVIALEAAQGDNKIIKNAEAELASA
jgi:hypothetical protein